MTLDLVWTNPSPLPACGYNVLYRAQGVGSYTTINTSGTTSGSSTLPILVSAPANYEGTIQANCCSGNNSPGASWGINAYSGLGVNIFVQIVPSTYYEAQVTSTYPNPYPTYLSGNFLLTTTSGETSGATTISFSNAVYPANSTSANITLSGTPPTANSYIVTNIVISSVVAEFDYGGGLQQFDALLTPQYFKFYYGTKPAWIGSTIQHPSFVLSSFLVTQQDTNNNALVGNLGISWIQGGIYMGGTGKYDNITLTVTDPASTVVGSVSFSQAPLGLRNNTIIMTRTSPSYPLTQSTLFNITATWADGSTISTTSFYLPAITF